MKRKVISPTLNRKEFKEKISALKLIAHCDTLQIMTFNPVMDSQTCRHLIHKEFGVSLDKSKKAIKYYTTSNPNPVTKITISPYYLDRDRCSLNELKNLIDRVAELIISGDKRYYIIRFDFDLDCTDIHIFDQAYKINHAVLKTFRDFHKASVKNSNRDRDDEWTEKSMDVSYKKKGKKYTFRIYNKRYVSPNEGVGMRIELSVSSCEPLSWDEVNSTFTEKWIEMLHGIEFNYDKYSIAQNKLLVETYPSLYKLHPEFKSSWANYVRSINNDVWSRKQLVDLLERLIDKSYYDLKDIENSIRKFYKINPTFGMYKRTDIQEYMQKIIDGIISYFHASDTVNEEDDLCTIWYPNSSIEVNTGNDINSNAEAVFEAVRDSPCEDFQSFHPERNVSTVTASLRTAWITSPIVSVLETVTANLNKRFFSQRITLHDFECKERHKLSPKHQGYSVKERRYTNVKHGTPKYKSGNPFAKQHYLHKHPKHRR